MCEALLDLNGIKPFETTEADHSGAADSGSGAPQAVPSTVSANTSSATASSSRSGASRKRRNGYEIIDIDEDEAVRKSFFPCVKGMFSLSWTNFSSID